MIVPDGVIWAIVLFATTPTLCGFGMGVQDPNEMGYRQAVTPHEMLGRMYATLPSANRSMAVVGSLSGGVLAGRLGYRVTLLPIPAVFVAALIIAISPARGARVH